MILEEQCSREIADFFRRLERKIHKVMEKHWESELGLFHLNKVSDIIQDSRQEYYDILFKYCKDSYMKGRESTERRFNRQLENISMKADVNITRLEDLFKPDPTIRYNLNSKVFQASAHTMDRVDNRIMENITQSYNDGLGIDEAKDRLTIEYNGLKSWEAQRIARTEINSAQNDGAFDVYGELGVEYHQWWTAQDERVRETPQADHRELHGKIVKVGNSFSNGLQYPGDRTGRIVHWINCRCTTLPFLMPLGKMAPPGMIEFTEEDLIDIPNFEMPTIDDLMGRYEAVEPKSEWILDDFEDLISLNEDEERRLAEIQEIFKRNAKDNVPPSYIVQRQYDEFMLRKNFAEKLSMLKRGQNPFLNESEKQMFIKDYSRFLKQYENEIRLNKELQKMYPKEFSKVAKDVDLQFYRENYNNQFSIYHPDDIRSFEVTSKTLTSEERARLKEIEKLYPKESKRIAKEMDLKYYEKRHPERFGRFMEEEERKRLAKIERMYPKETSKMANEFAPRDVSRLRTKEDIDLYEKNFIMNESYRKKADEIVNGNGMTITRNVKYDLKGRYEDYINITDDTFDVLRFKDYNCEIWISSKSEVSTVEIMQTLDKIPRKLMNQNHNRIIFSADRDVYNLKKNHFVGGVTKRKDNEIVIFKCKGGILSQTKTLAHELGHAWDNNLSKIANRGGAYYKVAEEEGGFVTSYARKGFEVFKTHYSEDFAEAMELYVTSPEKLRRKFPKRYEFIKNMMEDDLFVLGLIPY